jgi:uncharacterized protein
MPMKIEYDVPITMDDGLVLRADVFRPDDIGRYAVIMSYGPYGKGLLFQEAFKSAWERMIASFPEVAEGTSNRYQVWELADPEKWVPDGYVIVRVDSRGAGRSQGRLDIWSPREAQDIYQCVEWAATQSWSNGKVGLNGISYYAMNQWWTAMLAPPHLAAICVWEGAADYYRDLARHGGIFCQFLETWFPRQCAKVQHGVGERGPRDPNTNELVAGPETLTDEELANNRSNPAAEVLKRPLCDDYYRVRSGDLSKITVPMLSAANWGGQGLHPRGNFEGFVQASSEQKWLEVHGNTHFSPFYSNSGVALQKRFFGHFLKGEATGWETQPRVQLQIRHVGEKFVVRNENEWPLARTSWTKFYLHPDSLGLSTSPSGAKAAMRYATTGDGLTFSTPAIDQTLEITGPVAARLYLSSDTNDADIFLVLRIFAPDDKEVVFIGSNDPRTPVGLGWLRASHRKLDAAKSLPYRPYHAHDELWPLIPNTPVELDIEIWPTCIVVPKGYRIALTVRGTDYEYDGTDAALPHAHYPMKGVGHFVHNNPMDRPVDVFGGVNTLHFFSDELPYLLLPLIY